MLVQSLLGDMQNLRYPIWDCKHGLRRLHRDPRLNHCTFRLKLPPEQAAQQQSLKILRLPGHRIHIGVTVHLPVQQPVV